MPSTEGDHNNSKNDKRRWHHHATVWAAVAAAIGAALAAASNAYQACLMRQNNVVSQRAFVSISSSSVQGYVSFEPDGVTLKAVNLLLSLVNSGNTATKNLDLIIKCAPTVEDMQEPWSIIRQGQLPIGKVPIFIGPHATEVTGCSFSFDQVQQMKTGKLFGYLLVDVSYFDRLDTITMHRTQKALKLSQIDVKTITNATNVTSATVTSFLVPVGQHNCADEECP